MKVTYKTYLNDRLKQVDFHGHMTYPLYVQVTFERRTIFFKSYYFELFSKARYLLVVPGVGSKGPSMAEVIEKEEEVLHYIVEKRDEGFSLDLFKSAYLYYSKDLCDVMERGFVDYLHTFFWDEGNPALGDIVKYGTKHVIAYDAVRDFRRVFSKALYDKLITNSFYYAPPYFPLYGFMESIKRWPMKILTVMELERIDRLRAFRDYVQKYYPDMPADEVLAQVARWPDYL